MLPILVLFLSAIIPYNVIASQPTKNLLAKYYDHPNKWTGAGANFLGRVIHTRTFTSINTTNFNPAGRGNYWSVVIEGYIYAPQNGTYTFRTLSDDGIRELLTVQLLLIIGLIMRHDMIMVIDPYKRDGGDFV